MNFTEHINRIEYLTSQILVNVQKENYQKVREDLASIKTHAGEAEKQLENLQWAKSEGQA